MPEIEKIRGMKHNARGGLVAQGIGAATCRYPEETMCRDWAHGLRGWGSRELDKRLLPLHLGAVTVFDRNGQRLFSIWGGGPVIIMFAGDSLEITAGRMNVRLVED